MILIRAFITNHFIRRLRPLVVSESIRNMGSLSNAEAGKKAAAYKAVDEWLQVIYLIVLFISYLGRTNRWHWKWYNRCLRCR